MAIHEYDYPTEPLHRNRHRDAFDDPRRPKLELDRGTLWAGTMLGAALLVFMAYMVLAGPAT